METSLTPLLAMKSRALLTLAILWKRILPRSGLGNVSPEMTSSKSINLRPLRKSSSMFSIPVPALRRWELHQAVNVCRERERKTNYIRNSLRFKALGPPSKMSCLYVALVYKEKWQVERKKTKRLSKQRLASFIAGFRNQNNGIFPFVDAIETWRQLQGAAIKKRERDCLFLEG